MIGFIEIQESWTLEVVQKTIELNTETYQVHVAYPEYILSGQSLYIFNSVISAEVNNYVKNFIYNAGRLELNSNYELNSEYTTYTAYDRYITAKIDFYPYLGGSHPGHDILTITFDTAANAIVSLTDLLGTGNNKFEQLSRLAEAALFKKYPELAFAFNNPTYRSGYSPAEKNFQYWALADRGFIFFFPEYQAAPYAAGTLDVEIPYPLP